MKFAVTLCLVFGLWPLISQAYPLFASEELGMRRLEAARLAHQGEIPGSKRPAGELLSREQVDLRLVGHPNLVLPEKDDEFTLKIRKLLGKQAEHYSISLLDLSDLEHPRYAEHNGVARRNPGSVGKILVALGFFQALADAYPDEQAQRLSVLHDTQVTADEFIVYDHHKIRL